MPGQIREIIRLQPVLVPHLHGIGPALGELAEKFVEVGHEIASMLVIAGMEPGEFKHQQPDVPAEGLAWFEKSIHEQADVEKVFVDLAGAVAGVADWETFHP